MASWVWGAGGHFISDDGKHTRFSEPEALAGALAYFGLYRYMSPEMQNLSAGRASDLFRQGKVAATISGQWMMNLVLDQHDALPEVIDNLGVALVPGVPFVGGESLVIWAHTHHPREAVELVRFLTSRGVQSVYCMPRYALLPARLEALEIPPFTDAPHYQTVVRSLKKGKGFRATYMWGLVEERLGAALSELWQRILTDSSLDLERVVTEYLKALALRLDGILAG
jgi:multiple sugar transport system substrate-binding protein